MRFGPYTIDDREFRLIIGRTQIDYDPDKEAVNRRKHGYSLSCTQDVFSEAVKKLFAGDRQSIMNMRS
jgi:uncharacterized DUF497 family protein